MAQSPRWLLPLLAVLFFGSGACALVYQVMWLRLLALVFGVTVYAASTVLAGFMAGLGVGSFVGGRMATRFARPLVAFGVAEALVGITAFATPFVLEALTRVWVSVHAELPDSLFALTVIRFIVAFLVLIVPTSLMGATCRSSSSLPSPGRSGWAARSACSTPSTPLAPSLARSSRAFTSFQRSVSPIPSRSQQLPTSQLA